jgi:hypothetical protein
VGSFPSRSRHNNANKFDLIFIGYLGTVFTWNTSGRVGFGDQVRFCRSTCSAGTPSLCEYVKLLRCFLLPIFHRSNRSLQLSHSSNSSWSSCASFALIPIQGTFSYLEIRSRLVLLFEIATVSTERELTSTLAFFLCPFHHNVQPISLRWYLTPVLSRVRIAADLQHVLNILLIELCPLVFTFSEPLEARARVLQEETKTLAVNLNFHEAVQKAHELKLLRPPTESPAYQAMLDSFVLCCSRLVLGIQNCITFLEQISVLKWPSNGDLVVDYFFSSVAASPKVQPLQYSKNQAYATAETGDWSKVDRQVIDRTTPKDATVAPESLLTGLVNPSLQGRTNSVAANHGSGSVQDFRPPTMPSLSGTLPPGSLLSGSVSTSLVGQIITGTRNQGSGSVSERGPPMTSDPVSPDPPSPSPLNQPYDPENSISKTIHFEGSADLYMPSSSVPNAMRLSESSSGSSASNPAPPVTALNDDTAANSVVEIAEPAQALDPQQQAPEIQPEDFGLKATWKKRWEKLNEVDRVRCVALCDAMTELTDAKKMTLPNHAYDISKSATVIEDDLHKKFKKCVKVNMKWKGPSNLTPRWLLAKWQDNVTRLFFGEGNAPLSLMTLTTPGAHSTTVILTPAFFALLEMAKDARMAVQGAPVLQ